MNTPRRPTPRVSGPSHPLVSAYRESLTERNQALADLWPLAARMVSEHRRLGQSTQSVFRITATSGPLHAEYLGPVEDNGDLHTQQGYVVISDADLHGVPRGREGTTGDPRPGGGTIPTMERRRLDAIAGRLAPSVLQQADRYQEALAAADATAESVAPVLALLATRGPLEWDTGESVCAASSRLCMDMAWQTVERNLFTVTKTRLLADALAALDAAEPVSAWAEQYLQHRQDIGDDLDRLGIPLGGQMLDINEFTDRAGGIRASTLRGYVSRGTGPEPDSGAGSRHPKWHQCTVAAWLLARPTRHI